ncbi:MAG: NlpC/P60 family protein [Syntrophotaleaceae bacterium]
MTRTAGIARLLTLLMLAALVGCAPFLRKPVYDYSDYQDPLGEVIGAQTDVPLESMGYSTQVGAFGNLENAVRLEQLLQQRGIEAYYFRHESGLFKVRFGNHPSYQMARSEAERLQTQGLIDAFFIVIPEDYAAARIRKTGRGDLREELVRTAHRFLGVPYQWGGTDSQGGFDCSGLTMVCYRLNGLNLPRVSRNQFQAGRWVPKDKLQKGDLVFFATRGGNRVSHVGMYIGGGRFIHAPRTGDKVRIEKLSNSFFTKTYMGGRSYL